jgi:8-oxo-dGTP pyrophosphatase MutT (NUDIX family)
MVGGEPFDRCGVQFSFAYESESMPDVATTARPIQQFGALCVRYTIEGPEVLLVTTRETKRWMIPKGWPMAGLKPRKVAEQEAWEEAGVVGRVKKLPIGDFVYDKVLGDGSKVRPTVAVFLLEVRRQWKRFPESAQRRTAWLTPLEASRLIDEPDLERLILKFGRSVRPA